MNPYLLINTKYKLFDSTDRKPIELLFKFLMQLGMNKLVVRCVLIAAKMVLHFWENDNYTNKLKKFREIPRRAIEIAELWLEGKSSIEEVKAAADAAAAVDAAYIAYNVSDAAYAAGNAAYYAAHTAVQVDFVAASNAVYSANHAAKNKFFIEWGLECEPLIYNKLHEFIIKGEM